MNVKFQLNREYLTKNTKIRRKKEIIQAILDGDYEKAGKLFPYITNKSLKTETMVSFLRDLHQEIINQEQFIIERDA